MNIPSIKSIMLPFLQYLDDLQEHHRQTIANALAVKPFDLTPEQKAELMPKGMPVFDYRCDWAKTHLKEAGLVEAPTRGYSKITDCGLAFLKDWNNNPEEIGNAVKMPPKKFYDYVKNRWPVERKNNNQRSKKSEISMDFIEEIKVLSTKIQNDKHLIKNEAMTKAAFVIPFIKLLGYDTSNPKEVVPEYTTDFGAKQGEKVDYAIFKDNEVIMLIECKKYGTNLSDTHTSQLFRYFSTTNAQIAILTDGGLYQFYTDFEKSNIMDKKPFLEFNMLDIQQQIINQLKRFTKLSFNLNAIHIAANTFKYTQEIKLFLMEQLETPTKEFVQFFLSTIYGGKRTQAVVEQFSDIVKSALNQFLDEQMNQPSQSTINGEEAIKESIDVEKSEEKAAETRLHVTMSDQTEIRHDNASDTFCEILRKFGFEAVHEREPRVVSKDPFSHAKHRQVDGYWINLNNGTKPKKRILDRIAGKLGFGGAWNVKVIPK